MRAAALLVLVASLGATAAVRPDAAWARPNLGFGSGEAATPAAGLDALAGRLGGPRRTFEDAYGPGAEVSVSALYEVDGYGLVSVQYRPSKTPGPDDPAVRIVLRSPRPAAAAAAEPAAADWSLAGALAAARRFLPVDAVLGDEERLADDVVAYPCRSPALERVFADGGAVGCRASFVRPTPETVSFVALHMGGGPGGGETIPADRCRGMAVWAVGTGQRLVAAGAILEEAGRMGETEVGAAERLTLFSAQFRVMAAEQRRGPVPPAAEEPNRLLEAAFAAYAEAFDLAAAGIDGGPDLVERATARIGVANADYRRGVEVTTAALAGCGLVPATPEAG
jgi:hypothetical protein